MFVPHLLALSLLLNTVNEVSCPAERDIPLVEVIPVRMPPTFHHEDSAEDLTRKGTDAYAPPGTGPSWHKQGLTRASTTFEHKVESLVKQFPDGLTCIYVQKVELRVISEPTVWVANDFPRAPACTMP